MRARKHLLIVTLLANAAVSHGHAQENDYQQEIDSLRKRVEELEIRQTVHQNTNEHPAKKTQHQSSESNYDKYRIGGYGEMLLQHKDYSYNRWGGKGVYRMDRSEISIPRFVLAGDYKFTRWFQLGAEIEFEAGGVGTSWEQETGSGAENGELEQESEKGGEVALEQFHFTIPFNKAINLRIGHVVVPVGLTNAHHEPILFFGTSRPEGESKLIPSTWHETGLELYGRIGEGTNADISYQAQLVSGLTVDGLDKYTYLGKAKQGLFEQDLFTSPAFVGRLNYHGIKNLRIGGSIYWCNDAGQNSNYPHYYSDFKIPIRIFSGDAQYRNKWLTARANILHGNIGNTAKLTRATLGRTSAAYGGNTPVAKYGVSYGGEAGINIGHILNTKKKLNIYPFARYEYYNPQEKLADNWIGEVEDPRCQVSAWTFGVDWYALPYLVVKGDWTTRHIGTHKAFDWDTAYKSENDLSLGIAYVAWFNKK